jgi:outer membrane immunogenic protein
LNALGVTPSGLSLDDSGFIGGGQIGYNVQAGALVWGVEADISYLGIDTTNSFIGNPVLGTRLQTSAALEYGAFGTVRGRLGFLATPDFLIFATGGLAVADVTTRASVTALEAPGLAWSGETNETKVGYTVGFGGEYAFTPNMTFKLEYMYFDLGDQTTTANGNAAVRSIGALNGIDYVNKVDLDGSIVRAGLNFKF